MTDKKTAVITGANRGIGLELAESRGLAWRIPGPSGTATVKSCPGKLTAMGPGIMRCGTGWGVECPRVATERRVNEFLF